MSDSTNRQKDKRPVFSVAAFIAFGVLFAGGGWLVSAYGIKKVDELDFFDLVVLGLACLRLIHLITFDKIMEPLREYLERGNGHGYTRLLGGFIACIWCTGVWSGLIATTAYLLGSWYRFAVVILAVAALGSLLQVISRAVAGTR